MQWLGILITIAIPTSMIWWCWRSMRGSKLQRRIDAGRCGNCGYDLRASENRCPECGKPIPPLESTDYLPLRDEWPADPIEPRTPGAMETPVIVHVAANGSGADLLREQLEARGILCKVENRMLRRDPRAGPVMESIVKVWSGDAQHAKEIIQHLIPKVGAK